MPGRVIVQVACGSHSDFVAVLTHLCYIASFLNLAENRDIFAVYAIFTQPIAAREPSQILAFGDRNVIPEGKIEIRLEDGIKGVRIGPLDRVSGKFCGRAPVVILIWVIRYELAYHAQPALGRHFRILGARLEKAIQQRISLNDLGDLFNICLLGDKWKILVEKKVADFEVCGYVNWCKVTLLVKRRLTGALRGRHRIFGAYYLPPRSQLDI